jgi:flagellar M-ring protein FliF
MASQSQSLLHYGTIFVAMLFFFVFVARPALRSLAAPVRRAVPSSAAAPARIASAPALQELTPEQQATEQRKMRAQNVFEQVSENVRRDPAQSTRLLESWIRSE